MKILQLHADFIEYRPVKKEIPNAEEAETKTVRQEEILVLFTAVEQGDSEEVAKKAIAEAKEFLGKLNVNKIMIYPFAHLSQDLAKPSEARPVLEKMSQEAKAKGIEVYRAPFGWNKALQVKVKGHPLAEMSRSYSPAAEKEAAPIAPSKHDRRDLTERELISRMRRVDYADLAETDHRALGEKLDLFSFYEPSPSMPYWHDNGVTLKNILLETLRKEIKNRGYLEISTAPLANVTQWKVSGHWDYYRDNMFLTKLGEEDFSLKPMNCPSTLVWYNSKKWSYRDLPLRVACFDPLFRRELSGVATGLLRVKVLQMDDAHILCTEEQIGEELKEVIDLMDWLYKLFGLEYSARVSTMPDEHIGTEEQWERAAETLLGALKSKGIKAVIKEKEGAFYGPKIDVDIKDSLGRSWQCATIQLDYQLPSRFRSAYVGSDGQEHTPVMIHRALYGSLERFIGIILEHYRGNLPVWISPLQARVMSLSDEYRGYAGEVLEQMKKAGVRADGDFETATISYKVRNAQVHKIPYMLVIGEKEEKGGTLAVRTRDGRVRSGVKPLEFIKELKEKESHFE